MTTALVSGEVFYPFCEVSKAFFGKVEWSRLCRASFDNRAVVKVPEERSVTRREVMINAAGVREIALAFDRGLAAEGFLSSYRETAAGPTAPNSTDAQNRVALLQKRAADVLEAFYKEKGDAALRTAMKGLQEVMKCLPGSARV